MYTRIAASTSTIFDILDLFCGYKNVRKGVNGNLVNTLTCLNLPLNCWSTQGGCHHSSPKVPIIHHPCTSSLYTHFSPLQLIHAFYRRSHDCSDNEEKCLAAVSQ